MKSGECYVVEDVVLFDVDGLEEAGESDGRVAGESWLVNVHVLQVLQSVRVPGTGRQIGESCVAVLPKLN